MNRKSRTASHARMTHFLRRACSVLVLLMLVAPAWASAAQGGLTQAALRKGLHMKPDAKLSFQDMDGKPIDFATFARDLPHHSINKSEDGSSGDIVLRIARASKPHVTDASVVRPGQPFPAFRLHTLDGTPVDKSSLHGHPALISFFFDTCIPCIEEVPALNGFAKAHPEFRTLAVTFDSRGKAATFRKQRHLSWPIAYGAHKLVATLGVKNYPTLFLLDAQGHVVRAGHSPNAGRTREADIEHWVRSAGKQ